MELACNVLQAFTWMETLATRLRGQDAWRPKETLALIVQMDTKMLMEDALKQLIHAQNIMIKDFALSVSQGIN